MTYLDSTAKQALDALVGRLSEAVQASAGQAMVAPLEDLRARLASLGERESLVLERLEAVLAAGGQGQDVDAAAARTVEALRQEIQSGLERFGSRQLLETFEASLAAANEATLAKVGELAGALDALGRRLDEQALRLGSGGADLSGLAERLDALAGEQRRVLGEGLQDSIRDAVKAVMENGGGQAWRADLTAAAERVGQDVKRALVPAAAAMDERLVALAASGQKVEAQLMTLTTAQNHTAEAVKELGKGLAEGETRRKATLEELRTQIAAAKAPEHDYQAQLDVVARGLESLGGRLSFTQEALAGNANQAGKVLRWSRAAVMLVVLNTVATMFVVGALVRHFGW